MINCANFDFNWHIVYNYQDDVQPIYPAGTTLHVDQLSRQHGWESGQPRPEELDRWG